MWPVNAMANCGSSLNNGRANRSSLRATTNKEARASEPTAAVIFEQTTLSLFEVRDKASFTSFWFRRGSSSEPSRSDNEFYLF